MPTTSIPSWWSWTTDEWAEWIQQETDESNLTYCESCEDTLLARRVMVANPHSSEAEYRYDFLGWNRRRNQQVIADESVPLMSQDVLDEIDQSICANPQTDRYYDGTSYDALCDSCNDELYSSYGDGDSDYDSDNDPDSSRYISSYSTRVSVMFNDVLPDGYGAQHISALRRASRVEPAIITNVSGGQSYAEQPYCGFELEMSNDCNGQLSVTDAAHYLYDRVQNYALLKSDGSVSYGFELVTQPHSLDAYKMRTDMWDALDFLRRNGWRSWSSNSSCGLHIHINSRSFINDRHAIRFIYFIYHNKPALVRFAGRDSSYARFHFDDFVMRQVYQGDDEHGNPIYTRGTVKDIVAKKHMHDNRYLALNAQNSHTYELRFFRGNMRPKVVLACLEFVFALHEYTRNLDAHSVVAQGSLKWEKFHSWLRQYATLSGDNFRYGNLVARLSEARRNPSAFGELE